MRHAKEFLLLPQSSLRIPRFFSLTLTFQSSGILAHCPRSRVGFGPKFCGTDGKPTLHFFVGMTCLIASALPEIRRGSTSTRRSLPTRDFWTARSLTTPNRTQHHGLLYASRLPITNRMVSDPMITNAVANPQQIPCRPDGLTRRLASVYRGQSPRHGHHARFRQWSSGTVLSIAKNR